MHAWKVVPLSPGQLLDVNPDDILENGLYRKCNTYRGGGGYDQFAQLAARRLDAIDCHMQFIVQLRGCNLDCPYCYVTREGVWGEPTLRTTHELVAAFVQSGQRVFHLMGGAPALQMRWWHEILDELDWLLSIPIFHSDLTLTEGVYKKKVLDLLSCYNDQSLYAINIKGTTSEEWYRNTRKEVDWALLWSNWRRVEASGLNAYVTFTGCDERRITDFWSRAFGQGIAERWQEDSYNIDLIDYAALPHVDDRPWGAA